MESGVMYYEDEAISRPPTPDGSMGTNSLYSDKSVSGNVRKPYPKDIAEPQGMNPPLDYTSKYSNANIYDEDPISAVPPQAQPQKRIFSTSGETPDMTFETTKTAFESGFGRKLKHTSKDPKFLESNEVKTAAKEHGMEEHKGKTIPKEVKSLADRIRKKEPGKSDEYAYRTAWDIFRSYTAEGKKYPHKSPESGLAREGGGTGSLSKKGSVMEKNAKEKTAFEIGFEKAAGILSSATKAFGAAKNPGVSKALSTAKNPSLSKAMAAPSPQMPSKIMTTPSKLKQAFGAKSQTTQF